MTIKNLNKLITNKNVNAYSFIKNYSHHNLYTSFRTSFFGNFTICSKNDKLLTTKYFNKQSSCKKSLITSKISNDSQKNRQVNNINLPILKKLDQNIKWKQDGEYKLFSAAQEIVRFYDQIKIMEDIRVCPKRFRYDVSTPEHMRELRNIYFLWKNAVTSIKINQYKLSDKEKDALKSIDNLLDNSHNISGFTYYSPIEELV